MYIRFLNQSILYLRKNSDFTKYLFNTSWLFSEQIIRMGVSLVISVWVVRYLGPDKFGLLSYAQSLVGIFTAVATLGIDQIVVRELVKQNYRKETILGTSFVLKLSGALAVLSILFTAINFTSTDTETKILVYIIASGSIFQSFSVIGFLFQAEVRSKYSALANLGAFIIMTVSKIVMLIVNAPLIAFAFAILIDVIANSIGLIYFYKKKISNKKSWHYDKTLATNFLKESWPLILSSISTTIGMRIDQIMLKSYLDVESVGVYAAGVRLAEVFNFIPMIVGNSLFPKIVDIEISKEEKKLISIVRYVFFFLIGLALFVTACSYHTVVTLYGMDFLQSYKVLNVLIWTVPLVYLSVITNKLLLKINKSKIILARQVLVALINIILNVLLIPYYGILGSAFATLLSIVLVLILEGFSTETRWILKLKLKSLFIIK